MTHATSNQSDNDQIDTTVGTAKRLLIFAYKHYNEAMKNGDASIATYWDGYIRGIQHVLESQHE